MASPLNFNAIRAFDENANPVSGAKAYFYQPGTTTPLTVYSDEALTTPITQPLVADSEGVFSDVYNSAAVKVLVTDSAGATLTGYPREYEFGTGTIASQDADAVNIDGGTIDDTEIGQNTPAAGAFTTLSASSTATLNGGTIDGTAIGGTTPAAGAFTTLSATGAATFSAGAEGTPAIVASGDTNTGFWFPAADTIAVSVGASEAFRVASTGGIRFAQTGYDNPGMNNVGVGAAIDSVGAFHSSVNGYNPSTFNRNISDGAVVEFRRGGGASPVGSISVTTTATTYATSSDYRLKKDDKPIVGAIERIKSLRPVNFEWKVNGGRSDGFFAHEAQAVVPEAVHGTKDEIGEDGNPIYQGVDYSKIVPLLTAALQEAIARIEVLESAP